jgi:hypothetical protein
MYQINWIRTTPDSSRMLLNGSTKPLKLINFTTEIADVSTENVFIGRGGFDFPRFAPAFTPIRF